MQRPADLISVVQSKKSSKDKFKELLNRVVQGEADINARGEHGNTALHHAVLVRIISSTLCLLFFFLAIFFSGEKKITYANQLNT